MNRGGGGLQLSAGSGKVITIKYTFFDMDMSLKYDVCRICPGYLNLIGNKLKSCMFNLKMDKKCFAIYKITMQIII